jgi:diaminopimelate decarboxylase
MLSSEALHSYVEYYFNLSGKYMDTLMRHASPLYILDTSILRERAEQFKRAFHDVLPDTAFYYAMKSNNHPDVVRTLVCSDFGIDVSSGMELEQAVASGAKDIVFSGPGKTREELRLAVRYSDRVTVLIDSFGELARLEDIASAEDKIIRAGVRLAASKGSLWRKFGITPEELPLFREDTIKCSHINFCGLQFHCSWNRTPDAQVEFISTLGHILSGLPDLCREELEFIDIGGGYWPPQGEWLQPAGTREGKMKIGLGADAGPATDHYCLPSAGIESFAEQLHIALCQYIYPILSCKICFEPGRWICNDAMQVIMTVVDKKADDLIITDAGTNTVGWDRFETDYFPVLNLTRPSLLERECHIMGSLCTPHDVWGYTYWGDEIQEGDILMIPEQGAYTYSLRQHFIKPLPHVVTL